MDDCASTSECVTIGKGDSFSGRSESRNGTGSPAPPKEPRKPAATGAGGRYLPPSMRNRGCLDAGEQWYCETSLWDGAREEVRWLHSLKHRQCENGNDVLSTVLLSQY